MKIGVAQIRPLKGAVARNIEAHLGFVQEALAHGADVLAFPELSITGYEPELANELGTDPADSRLAPFRRLSDEHGLTIGIGIPLRAGAGVRIGMHFFQPVKPGRTYAKQHLHPDELPYFQAGAESLSIRIGDQTIAPAICYESLLPEHAEQAAQEVASIYLASVAKSVAGVDKAYRHYASIARTHGLTVLMANCVGPCDNFQSAGQSAIWNRRGELLGRLDAQQEGILLLDTQTQDVITIPL